MKTVNVFFLVLILSLPALSNAQSRLVFCENKAGETLDITSDESTGAITAVANLIRTGRLTFDCVSGQDRAQWICTHPKYYNYTLFAVVLNPAADGTVTTKIGFSRGGFRQVAAPMLCR